MDSSLAIQKFPHHARSTSFPSRSHPLTLQVEEQLCRLRSSELATTSSSLICHNLVVLQDLYEAVDELIQLPHTLNQVSLSSERQVDQVLDGSLKLLDVCRTTRETLSQMKQSVQDLQSSLRRRGADSDIRNEVCSYMTSRKKGNKVIQKCIKDMKKMDAKSVPFNKENDMVTILSEVQTSTLAVFASLLSLPSSEKARSNESNWSVISKLKRARSTKEGKNTTEMEKVDALLKTLSGQKSCKGIETKDAQMPLEALEMSLQGLEDELECLFRLMIKARVSLLNIHNQY